MGNVRDSNDWNTLISIFESVEHADKEQLVKLFQRVLRSMVRRLADQLFGYAIPQRISPEQLRTILKSFLAKASGGFRPQAIVTALMRVVGDGFSLFAKVESQGINEADAARGLPGDVICYQRENPGQVSLVIEVKDMNLTFEHVDAASIKAKRSNSGIANLLFTTHGMDSDDREKIVKRIATEWTAGTMIYMADVLWNL